MFAAVSNERQLDSHSADQQGATRTNAGTLRPALLVIARILARRAAADALRENAKSIDRIAGTSVAEAGTSAIEPQQGANDAAS
jgi:hypothetical protein